VIQVLVRADGPRGTLLMPTLSSAASAVAYARKRPVFNPARTPSSVGIVTEVFRRRDDVQRSLHPTHSVAGIGEEAYDFLAGHHLAESPCGRGTPYHRLIERDGKVVLLNAGFGALTLYHCIEELIEPLLPFSPFTEERFVLEIRDGAETLRSAAMRLFDPGVSARRNLDPLRRRLERTGALRAARVGNVPILVVAARDALAAAEELAREGVFCYDPEPQGPAR
jgi:aminoglycoside 3-N-acetyltransferase